MIKGNEFVSLEVIYECRRKNRKMVKWYNMVNKVVSMMRNKYDVKVSEYVRDRIGKFRGW